MTAKSSGLITEYVNPGHTFRTCFRCFYISKNSINGLKFLFKACSFELNADLNGARKSNIEHETIHIS